MFDFLIVFISFVLVLLSFIGLFYKRTKSLSFSDFRYALYLLTAAILLTFAARVTVPGKAKGHDFGIISEVIVEGLVFKTETIVITSASHLGDLREPRRYYTTREGIVDSLNAVLGSKVRIDYTEDYRTAWTDGSVRYNLVDFRVLD